MGTRLPPGTGTAIGRTRWQWGVRRGSGPGLWLNRAVPQRCIFHKLHNVATKCRSELKGKEKRDLRKQLMEQAAAIYQATTGSSARTLLVQWGKQWREQAPQSVATLERDFEQTLVFYALSGLTLEWIRTTSLLERTNRELRRKCCQVVTFGSHKGAEVAVYLQVQRLHARWSGESWWDTSHALYFELRNLHS
jgi:transposase-like protein